MNTEQRLHDITEMLLLVRDNLFHGMSKSIQKLQARSINEALDLPNFMTDYKDPLIEAAVLAEREACAKVCEEQRKLYGSAIPDCILAIAALPVPEVQYCNWTQGYDDAVQGAWKTDCDSYWYIIDGSPSDNKMKFCHGCGKPIAEHPYVEAEDAE